MVYFDLCKGCAGRVPLPIVPISGVRLIDAKGMGADLMLNLSSLKRFYRSMIDA